MNQKGEGTLLFLLCCLSLLVFGFFIIKKQEQELILSRKRWKAYLEIQKISVALFRMINRLVVLNQRISHLNHLQKMMPYKYKALQSLKMVLSFYQLSFLLSWKKQFLGSSCFLLSSFNLRPFFSLIPQIEGIRPFHSYKRTDYWKCYGVMFLFSFDFYSPVSKKKKITIQESLWKF